MASVCQRHAEEFVSKCHYHYDGDYDSYYGIARLNFIYKMHKIILNCRKRDLIITNIWLIIYFQPHGG